MSAQPSTRAFGAGVPVIRLAPAKLNLTLAVLGRRPDGYHDLHSVVVRLGLADRLSLASSPGREDSLRTEGFDPGPPESNLVPRAITLARAEVARSRPGGRDPAAALRIAPPLAARLEKRIPVAAGLGGGSSDAAAALGAALEAWGAELGGDDLVRLGARLGSDVPLFFASEGSPVLVEGRGDRVTRLPSLAGAGSPAVLLVTPAIGVSTPDAFAAYDAGIRPGVGARAASDHLAAELQRGLDVPAFLARAGVLAAANDLLPAARALVPGLADMQRALSRLLTRPVGQSGSGPTSWVLYPSLEAAEEAARAVRAAIGDGAVPAPGDGPPFVLATMLAAPAGAEQPDGGRQGVQEEGPR